MRLRVDLERLAETEGPLLAAAQAAREMASCRGDLPDLATADRSQALREAIERFVDGWSYGMDLVADDAGRLVSLLRAAREGGRSAEAFHEQAWPAGEPEVQDTLRVTITEEADRIEILATWLATCAEQATEGAGRLRAVDSQAWAGEGEGAFRQALGRLSSRLDEGGEAFREAASTLRAYAAVLWEAQLRARQAGIVAANLYAGERTPSGRMRLDGGDVFDVPPLGTLEDSKAAVEAATHRAAARLRQAADIAPHRPGSTPPAADDGGGSPGGVWGSVWGLGAFAFEVTPVHKLIDPKGYVEGVKGLADELLDGASHPVPFADGAAGWDTWLAHRARTLGQLLPTRSETPIAAEDEVPVAAEDPHVVEVPGARAEGAPFGARGLSSGRPFDPASAGGPMRRLTASRIRMTPRAVAVVERHVARFGPDDVDAAMLARLRRIAAGELEATPTDRDFYTHQMRTFVRYRRLGHATGDPGYDVWNNAHTAALEDYSLREGPHVLYPVGDGTTDYEQAVLRAIASGKALARWYKIEQRLAVMSLEARDYLPDALRGLGSRGLVRQGEGAGNGYALTRAGERLLANRDA